MRNTTFIIPAVVVLVAILLSSVFIVDEREKALVLQFGQIKSVKEEPGLAFKIPLIQEVVRYDDRIQALDTDPTEVTPSDDRRLVVDAFARYRISDVVQFRQAVGANGMRGAEDRLEGILNPVIRAVLGSNGVTSNTILSADRAGLMARITEQARQRALPWDWKSSTCVSSRRTCPSRTLMRHSRGCGPNGNAKRRTKSRAVKKLHSGCVPKRTGRWSS